MNVKKSDWILTEFELIFRWFNFPAVVFEVKYS